MILKYIGPKYIQDLGTSGPLAVPTQPSMPPLSACPSKPVSFLAEGPGANASEFFNLSARAHLIDQTMYWAMFAW